MGMNRVPNAAFNYETGTFTPDLKNTGSSSTFTSKVGYYTKIGNLVYAFGTVDGGNSGTAGGVLNLSNLPFNASSRHVNNPILVSFAANGLVSTTNWTCRITSGNSFDIRDGGGTNATAQVSFASFVIIYTV